MSASVVVRPLSATQTATRRKIVDAAIAIATEEGYDGVTMRTVAARAGVSAPTAYQYFTSKDHLLVDALIALVGSTTAAFHGRAAPATGSPAARASTVLRKAVARVRVAPKLYVALTRAYISGAPEVAHGRPAMEGALRQWIAAAVEGTDVDPAVPEVLEMVLFSCMVGLVTGARTPDDIGDALERAAHALLPTAPQRARRKAR